MSKKKKKQEAHIAGILRTRDGILLVRKKKADHVYWSLPMGKIELHETPQIALKRIFWAETGLLVDLGHISNTMHSDVVSGKQQTTHRLSSAFFVKKVGGELREGVVKFMKPRNLHDIRLNERSRLFLASAR